MLKHDFDRWDALQSIKASKIIKAVKDNNMNTMHCDVTVNEIECE